MPKQNNDTVPISIRMPRGSVDRLRATTGMPFSTLARLVLMQLLLRAEALAAREGGQRDKVSSEIKAIAEEQLQ